MLSPAEDSTIEKLLIDVNDYRRKRKLAKMYKPYLLSQLCKQALKRGLTIEEIATID